MDLKEMVRMKYGWNFLMFVSNGMTCLCVFGKDAVHLEAYIASLIDD
jgi:hypothetical protein